MSSLILTGRRCCPAVRLGIGHASVGAGDGGAAASEVQGADQIRCGLQGGWIIAPSGIPFWSHLAQHGMHLSRC